MSAVFADTFYFLALMNRSDAAHARSVAFAEQHRGLLITTGWILVEFTDAWARTRRSAAARFVQQMRNDPKLRVVPPSQSQLDRGLELFASRSDKEWSLTDCISFVVMEEEGITEALTADRHFEQAGFTALLK